MLSLFAVYAALVVCWTLAARLRRRGEPSPEGPGEAGTADARVEGRLLEPPPHDLPLRARAEAAPTGASSRG